MSQLIQEGMAAGRNTAQYIDQGGPEREAMNGGVFGGIMDRKIRIRRTLGAFSWKDNGDGTATIRDTYNYNDDPENGMPDRKRYYDAVNAGDTDAATDILFKYYNREPKELVAIASIFAYVRQERLREAGKPFETPVEIIVPLLPQKTQ